MKKYKRNWKPTKHKGGEEYPSRKPPRRISRFSSAKKRFTLYRFLVHFPIGFRSCFSNHPIRRRKIISDSTSDFVQGILYTSVLSSDLHEISLSVNFTRKTVTKDRWSHNKKLSLFLVLKCLGPVQQNKIRYLLSDLCRYTKASNYTKY